MARFEGAEVTQDRKDGFKICATLFAAATFYGLAIYPGSNGWVMLGSALGATFCAGIMGLWVRNLGKDQTCRTRDCHDGKSGPANPPARPRKKLPARASLIGPENAKSAERAPLFLKPECAGLALLAKPTRLEAIGDE